MMMNLKICVPQQELLCWSNQGEWGEWGM